MPPSAKFPLRVRHVGTDPVHGARRRRSGDHVTACLTWLDPEHSHVWCAEETEVTCTECIERMGPMTSKYVAEVPGAVGTLQERLADVIGNEVPTGYSELAEQRIAEAVEKWHREVEGRIREVVDEVLAELIPDTTRFGATRLLTEKVLRSMDVGGNVTSEGGEK